MTEPGGAVPGRGLAEPDPRRQRRALLLRWSLLPAVLVVGWVLYTVLSAAGHRAGWSFAGGLALTVASFEFGAYNVRFAARWFPSMTLAAAVGSYLVTVIAIGLVYTLASPAVVDGIAIAVGIFCAVAVWLGTEVERARVWSEHPEKPVRVPGR